MAAVPPDSWELPALGVWNVRDLAGHASRALLTVETYLDPLTVTDRPALPDPLAYLRGAGADLVDPATVAERGRPSKKARFHLPVCRSAARRFASRTIVGAPNPAS